MKPIAIILARSGSKGIRNKNILPLAGKPLFFYTIEVALASGLFSEVWVNSDSQAYLDLCQPYGVRTYLRSRDLARDESSSLETLTDFLEGFADDQAFALLQPTSPYREVWHLEEAWQLFCESGADHLISFTRPSQSRSLFTQLGEGNFILPPEKNLHFARQKEPVYYYPNGSIWLSTKATYLRDQGFYAPGTIAYLMDKAYSYDIDDWEDFQLLEGLMTARPLSWLTHSRVGDQASPSD